MANLNVPQAPVILTPPKEAQRQIDAEFYDLRGSYQQLIKEGRIFQVQQKGYGHDVQVNKCRSTAVTILQERKGKLENALLFARNLKSDEIGQQLEYMLALEDSRPIAMNLFKRIHGTGVVEKAFPYHPDYYELRFNPIAFFHKGLGVVCITESMDLESDHPSKSRVEKKLYDTVEANLRKAGFSRMIDTNSEGVDIIMIAGMGQHTSESGDYNFLAGLYANGKASSLQVASIALDYRGITQLPAGVQAHELGHAFSNRAFGPDVLQGTYGFSPFAEGFSRLIAKISFQNSDAYLRSRSDNHLTLEYVKSCREKGIVQFAVFPQELPDKFNQENQVLNYALGYPFCCYLYEKYGAEKLMAAVESFGAKKRPLVMALNEEDFFWSKLKEIGLIKEEVLRDYTVDYVEKLILADIAVGEEVAFHLGPANRRQIPNQE